jgi:hypothetical protein
MGRHLPDYRLSKTWVNLSTLPEYEDIVDVKIGVQAKNGTRAFINIGSEDRPTGYEGVELNRMMSFVQTAEHWWVKGTGTLSIWLED